MVYQSAILIHGIIGAIILSVGIIGNSIVIYFFGCVKKCKKNYELLIMILGVVDFLTCLSNFSFEWYQETISWPKIISDNVLYKVFGKLAMSVNLAACYVLLLMFYVRYQNIVDPVGNKMTKLKIVVVSLFIFSVCVAVYVPIGLDEGLGPFPHLVWYTLTIFVFCRVIIPVTLMTYCYYSTMVYLQRSAVTLNNEMVNKRNKRVLRTILWLMILFVASVGILGIWELYYFLKRSYFICSFTDTFSHYVISVLLYMNSALNVFIYAGYMADFRKFCNGVLICFKSN